MPLFAIAEHRQAYAGWCNGQGVKQNHAVFLRDAKRLNGLALNADQFIFVPGWQKSADAEALWFAYSRATGGMPL